MLQLSSWFCHFSESVDVSQRVFKPLWNKKNNELPVNKFYFGFDPKIFKKVCKWIKFIIYCVIFIFILWSCFQTLFHKYVNSVAQVGQGLEFGYVPGTTGSLKYDLQSNGDGNLYSFHSFTFAYGPFFALFVYPLAKLFINLMYGMAPALEYGGFNTLITMILIMLFLRMIIFWTTLKTAFLTEKQQEHQGAIAEINSKYEKFKNDRESKYKKHQEVSAYNKKHGISHLSMVEGFIINTPIFLIIYRLVTIVRPIKSTVLFGIWDLSETPGSQIFYNFFENGWLYIFFCLLIIPVNFGSQKISGILAKKRNPNASALTEEAIKLQKKNEKIQNIMAIVFAGFIFIMSSALGVYYFFSSIFTIIQSIVIHHIILKNKNKKHSIDKKLIRFGIKDNEVEESKLTKYFIKK